MPKRLPITPLLFGILIVLFTVGKPEIQTTSTTISAQEVTGDESKPNQKIDKTPQKLFIPSINLSAPIKTVGFDSERRMEVPGDNSTVSWWKYGALPGETGSAVIAGHYKITDGSPGVFYNLGNVKIGSKIIISFKNKNNKTFTVTHIKTYTEKGFPIQTIYTANDSKRLNLITCSGDFDSTANDYTHRLVVYAEFVN